MLLQEIMLRETVLKGAKTNKEWQQKIFAVEQEVERWDLSAEDERTQNQLRGGGRQTQPLGANLV